MRSDYRFIAKRVYVTDKRLYLEFEAEQEAKVFMEMEAIEALYQPKL
jgi:hypothetical protein